MMLGSTGTHLGLEYVGGDVCGGVTLSVVVHDPMHPMFVVVVFQVRVVVDDLPFATFEAVPTWAALLDETLLASKRRSRFVTSANRFTLGSVVCRWEGDATRLTCAGGGTALTSLREGRRPAMAFLRYLRPSLIVAEHPRPPGEVGWCWQLVEYSTSGRGTCKGCASW